MKNYIIAITGRVVTKYTLFFAHKISDTVLNERKMVIGRNNSIRYVSIVALCLLFINIHKIHNGEIGK